MTDIVRKPRFAPGLALVGLLLVGAGCMGTPYSKDVNIGVNGSTGANGKAPRELMLVLGEQNSSGVSGDALLIEEGSKTRVLLRLDRTTAGKRLPAHVHLGACPAPGEVKYSLSDVVDGKSSTVVDASFDSLISGLPLAINVHKSADETSVYFACGDLKLSAVGSYDGDDRAQLERNPEVKADAAAIAYTTVELKTLGKLGLSGTADVFEENGKTKVSISLKGKVTGAYPAHIHLGACPKPGEVKHSLSDVVGGKSVTTIDASLDKLMASGALSINVHESKDKLDSYVACGNLPAWDAVKSMFKVTL